MAAQDLTDLQAAIRSFAKKRDWDQFHTPKNLAMAIAAEAGELLAEFQWLTPDQSSSLGSDERARVEDEIADVTILLLRLCDVLDVDPLKASQAKLAKNELRYPAEQVKGKATKYNRL